MKPIEQSGALKTVAHLLIICNLLSENHLDLGQYN